MKKIAIIVGAFTLPFINVVTAQTEARFNTGTSTIITGTNATGNYFRIKTFDGTLDLGPQNASWCHLSTDKDRFYFNKPVFIANGEFISYGGTNLSLKTGITGTTGSTTRLTILNSNGYVGIGTTSPSTMLHVAGSSTIEGSMKMTGISATDMSGTASTSNKVMLLNNSTNQIVKTSIGDLVNTLYVAGPADLDPSLCMGLWDPTLCTTTNYTSTPVWKNNPGYGQIFAMCANVGIGTSNPNYTLDVNGNARISANVGVGAAPNCTTKILASASNTTDEFIRFNNPNGTQFKVDNAGFLTCRDITVTLNSIPDYVFEPDYQLLSLKEVKNYIDANKHLPNVPSATEMVEKNTTVGELNMMLLEKVEELTLYILQLEKRIGELETR